MTALATPDHDHPSLRPEELWRALCFVHPRLIVTGDLPVNRTDALEQLADWVEAGVTHIVDVRGEWSDQDLVARYAPHIRYVWVGVDDAGDRRDDAWWEFVLDALGDAIHDPDAVILVHCHMGVNRGPSMALRILLEQGEDAIDALAAIRAARPIAAVIYADDAVDHYHRSVGCPDTIRVTDRRRVRRWHRDHPIDTGWVISRIRRAE